MALDLVHALAMTMVMVQALAMDLAQAAMVAAQAKAHTTRMVIHPGVFLLLILCLRVRII